MTVETMNKNTNISDKLVIEKLKADAGYGDIPSKFFYLEATRVNSAQITYTLQVDKNEIKKFLDDLADQITILNDLLNKFN